MSTPADDQAAMNAIQAAMDRYLDGSLDAPGIEALNRSLRELPHLQQELAERLLLEATLVRTVRVNASPARPGARTMRLARQARSRMLPRLVLAAAALVLCAATIWWSTARAGIPTGPTSLPIGSIHAEVAAVVVRGERIPAVAGMALLPGDHLVSDASGSLDCHLSGWSTELHLAAGSEVILPATSADGLQLVSGTIDATVRKRIAGTPALIFTTSDALIEIVGTTFSLSVEDSGTRLTVREGIVEARRRDGDRASAQVRAGQQLLIGGRGPLTPRGMDPAVGRHLRLGAGAPYAHFQDLPVLQPGDVVEIAAGTYHECVRLEASGADGRTITIHGEDGVILDGSGLDLSGEHGPRALLEIVGAHYQVSGVSCRNARNREGNAAGIRLLGGGGTTITGCTIVDCDDGIAATDCQDETLERCVLSHNGIRGLSCTGGNIMVENGDRCAIERCDISDAVVGDNIWSTARWTEIAYCRIADADADGADIELSAPHHAAWDRVGAVIIGCFIHCKGNRPGNQVQAIAIGGAPQVLLSLINDTVICDLPSISLIHASGSDCEALMVNCLLNGSMEQVALGVQTLSGSNNWLGAVIPIPTGLQRTRSGSDPGLDADQVPLAGSPCRGAGAPPAYLDLTHHLRPLIPSAEPAGLPHAGARRVVDPIDIGARASAP